MSHEVLIVLWFVLIAGLWVGFFFLEGFDFGVAMLYPVIGKDPTERRVMINTIGPTWDGNEVWLITAGGAMFAAFPGWYATLFSGLYMPLLLVLLGLIARGVSFEYRALMPDDNWRDTFDWASTIGCLIVTLVFGIGFTTMWQGMPVAGEPALMTHSFWSLFTPFTLLGGVMLIVLFMVHGATFLSLKTSGSVHDKAHGVVRQLGPVAVGLLAVYFVVGNVFYGASGNPHLGTSGNVVVWVLSLVSVAALGTGVVMSSEKGVQKRENLAFTGTGVAIATLFAAHFVRTFGTLGFIPDAGTDFDMTTAASSPGTLRLMSIAAAVALPVVLVYTIWSYSVFRRRISVDNMPPEPSAPQPAGATKS